MNEMLNQTFGVEVEMYHITRERAASVLASSLTHSTGRAWSAWWQGGTYDAWKITNGDESSPVWMIERDSSISDTYSQQVELVTPVLNWDDMPLLQQVLRDLRKAGARSDPVHMCGIHVHVGADGHTARSLRNLANIMASHEQLLTAALALDDSRVAYYAQPVDPRFLRAVNLQKPDTMAAVQALWYGCQGGYDGSHEHYHRSRYHMLNLHSLFSGKGLEFRLFQFDNYHPNAPKGQKGGIHAGQLKAYVQLCLALSHRAKVARSSSPTVLQTDNPRYAMRCWLLRLGFIGDEFATARAVYTRRLEGDCSFRHGRPQKAEPALTETVAVNPAAFVGEPDLFRCEYIPIPDLRGQLNCRHSLL